MIGRIGGMTAADWIKFTPGWLAFVISVGTLVHKWWRGRHARALGPDSDALRALLVDFRTWFGLTLFNPVSRTQLEAIDGTDGAYQRLNDLAARRSDKQLVQYLGNVADQWGEFSGYLLRDRPYTQPNSSDQAEWEAEQERVWVKQQLISAQGRDEVSAALRRLNELERRTVGES